MKGKKVSADDVYFWANWVLVGALILGVAATYAIVVSGNIKDKELKRELAEADERTEGLRKSNLTLQGEVERERMERLKLEAIVAPRSLSLDQQRTIATDLKAFSGRVVSVTTYSLDADGALLGQQIIASLKAAGITVDDHTASMMPLGGFAMGVHLSGTDQNLVNTLFSALTSKGQLSVAPPGAISPGGASMSTGNPSTVAPAASILIGVKPIVTIK